MTDTIALDTVAATIKSIPRLPTRVPLGGVALTRVVWTALGQLGVHARPIACDIWVGNSAARDARPGAYATNVDVGVDKGRGHQEWRGHLVIAGDDWMADVMIDRYHDPLHGIVLPGALISALPIDLVDGALHRVELAHDGVALYRVHPDVARFRHTPEWQSAPLSLVPLLVAAAQEAS